MRNVTSRLSLQIAAGPCFFIPAKAFAFAALCVAAPAMKIVTFASPITVQVEAENREKCQDVVFEPQPGKMSFLLPQPLESLPFRQMALPGQMSG